MARLKIVLNFIVMIVVRVVALLKDTFCCPPTKWCCTTQEGPKRGDDCPHNAIRQIGTKDVIIFKEDVHLRSTHAPTSSNRAICQQINPKRHKAQNIRCSDILELGNDKCMVVSVSIHLHTYLEECANCIMIQCGVACNWIGPDKRFVI